MKIVIWGHALHSHTHSYIHYGFYRGFKLLGYDTVWYNDQDDVSNVNFDNCLFLTEGQVDKKIPINKSSKYILHNCDGARYSEIASSNKFNMQFYHNDVLRYGPLNKMNDYTYVGSDIIYQPWATDLLPHEIDENQARNEITNRECVWIGSYDQGDRSEFQNNTELDPFFNQCRLHGINIRIINPWISPVSPEENRKIINCSFLAPAINGAFQKRTHYIPCRIFKNISYGHLGITNNIHVNKIFDEKLIYDESPIELFKKALEKKKDSKTVQDIRFLMNEVKNKHTYINRIHNILECLNIESK